MTTAPGEPTERPDDFLELPVLPLRGTVLTPRTIVPLTIGRPNSLRIIESLGPLPCSVVFATEHDAAIEPSSIDVLYPVATLGQVLQLTKTQEHPPIYTAVAQGVQRLMLLESTQNVPFLRARVRLLRDIAPSATDPAYIALEEGIRSLFSELVMESPILSRELISTAASIGDASGLTDFVSAMLPSLSTEIREELLATLDVRQRMRRLTEELLRERESLRLQEKIQGEAQQKVLAAQREYFLREQLKAIQKELGISDEGRELEELKSRIEIVGMPEEAKKEAGRELGRLIQMPAASPEYSVVRTYLDWILCIPWNRCTSETVDVAKAEQILNEDHYDLERVKERVIEYLAVLELKRQPRGPILCFVGPPGVGKTSLGKSIARALGRKFVRLSLGGISDEAEIRGHRRTYVGALPGQIVRALCRAQSNDPVFMLDEVDKLASSFRGDPAAALLEVLDPEQNSSFRDNYLDVVIDLSRVMFVTTANVLDPIPPALLDRMEVIELAGYSDEEKLHIARQYLVKRQAEENGLSMGEHIRFADEAILGIIHGHTREAGVRSLEREIGAICRKQARVIATTRKASPLIVTPEVVRERLGIPRYRIETELDERSSRPGVAVGLARTPQGGDVLFIEASRMPRDKGDFSITGQVGPVMVESARAALSWLRANAYHYGIDPETFRQSEVHVHVPLGAVPKDGPSAGVALASALVSAFLDQPIRPRLAMTGEVTLTGHVLPVGAIKEKVLAARRSGIREVILPEKNEPNLIEDVPPHIREDLEIHFVHTISEALLWAFPELVHSASEPLPWPAPGAMPLM